MQSSIYSLDEHAQSDGGRYVYERHTDTDGTVYAPHPWLASAALTATDIQDRVTARGVKLDAQLAEAEAAALLEGE